MFGEEKDDEKCDGTEGIGEDWDSISKWKRAKDGNE